LKKNTNSVKWNLATLAGSSCRCWIPTKLVGIWPKSGPLDSGNRILKSEDL